MSDKKHCWAYFKFGRFYHVFKIYVISFQSHRNSTQKTRFSSRVQLGDGANKWHSTQRAPSVTGMCPMTGTDVQGLGLSLSAWVGDHGVTAEAELQEAEI